MRGQSGLVTTQLAELSIPRQQLKKHDQKSFPETVVPLFRLHGNSRHFFRQHRRARNALADRDLKFYVETFEKTGFTGGINWYRAMKKPWEEITKREMHWGLELPCLYLWPEQDSINVMGLEVGLEDYISDLESIPS